MKVLSSSRPYCNIPYRWCCRTEQNRGDLKEAGSPIIVQSKIDTEPREVSGDWSHADSAYHRFNENVNEAVVWLKLIIEAKAK